MSPVEWRPFCLGIYVYGDDYHPAMAHSVTFTEMALYVYSSKCWQRSIMLYGIA